MQKDAPSVADTASTPTERPLLLRQRIKLPHSLYPKDLSADIRCLDTFIDYLFALVDLTEDRADAKRKLIECRRDVDAQQSRKHQIRDFIELMKKHSTPPEYQAHLFDGIEQDLELGQLESQFDLIRYCYNVSAAPMLIIFHMFEAADEALKFAVDLGIGLELTRVARDIAPDAAKDKFYLPLETVRPDKLILGLKKDHVWELAVLRMQKQLFELAHRYLESAIPGTSLLSRDGWLPHFYMARLGQLIGERTLNMPTNFLLDPLHLTLLDKIKALVFARRQTKVFTALGKEEFTHDSELHIAVTGLPGANTY